jgi:hypothetical protein
LLDHLRTKSLNRNNFCSAGVSVEPDPGYHSRCVRLHSELFIADIISAQTTSRRSRFNIKGLEEPQYYPCQ